jgi:UDP-N-acetylmuramyl pentapeptide phosphotransferase/UDP-N-acetylglucosamine-1-phosphate transferase
MYGVMAFSLAGSTLAFLIYNFSPAKIFMGDTGSLLLGLINSILVIKFINIAGSPVSTFPIEAAPAIGFAVLMIPLFDTLRIFAIRILDRRSPFSPDRNHVHHFLLDMGLNHKMVTITCVLANIAFIGLAYAMRYMGTTTVIGALLALAFLFIGVIYYYSRLRTRALQQKGISKTTRVVSSHKVLSLASDAIEVE